METDEEFRDRYYKSVDFAGGVNADAIQAAILQNVEGVLAARVYENDTDYENCRGLPPHSIEAVVCAGLDFEVAKVIYAAKGASIQTHGSSMVEIVSPQNGQTCVAVWRLIRMWTSPKKIALFVAIILYPFWIQYLRSLWFECT